MCLHSGSESLSLRSSASSTGSDGQALSDPAALRAVLAEHWLAGIDCDHETKADRPRCACSRINFGWYRTVGEAVDRWAQHVADQLAARAAGQEAGR